MERAQNTKGKILDAGLRLFARKGYVGTTTREIASEAKIAECTIFKHFPTKLSLFETLVTSYQGFQIHISLEDMERLEYRDALLLFSRGFLDMLIKNKDLVRVFLIETISNPDKLIGLHNHLTKRADDVITSFLRRLQTSGRLRAFDIPDAVKILKGMILFAFQANLFFPRTDDQEINWEKDLAGITDFFVNATLSH